MYQKIYLQRGESGRPLYNTYCRISVMWLDLICMNNNKLNISTVVAVFYYCRLLVVRSVRTKHYHCSAVWAAKVKLYSAGARLGLSVISSYPWHGTPLVFYTEASGLLY